MRWVVIFLNDAVQAEFLQLPAAMQASLLKIMEMVETYGLQQVGMPYVRHIRGKLWEMRGKGRDGIARSIYVAASGRRVIVLRSFVKKTQQTPEQEIALALKRAREIRE